MASGVNIVSSGELLFHPIAGLIMRVLLFHGPQEESNLVEILHEKQARYSLPPASNQDIKKEVEFLSKQKVLSHSSPYALTTDGEALANDYWKMHMMMIGKVEGRE